jgi:hypothetical protein
MNVTTAMAIASVSATTAGCQPARTCSFIIDGKFDEKFELRFRLCILPFRAACR